MEMLAPIRRGHIEIGTATLGWQQQFQGYHRENGLIAKANDVFLSAALGTPLGCREPSPDRAGPLLVRASIAIDTYVTLICLFANGKAVTTDDDLALVYCKRE